MLFQNCEELVLLTLFSSSVSFLMAAMSLLSFCSARMIFTVSCRTLSCSFFSLQQVAQSGSCCYILHAFRHITLTDHAHLHTVHTSPSCLQQPVVLMCVLYTTSDTWTAILTWRRFLLGFLFLFFLGLDMFWKLLLLPITSPISSAAWTASNEQQILQWTAYTTNNEQHILQVMNSRYYKQWTAYTTMNRGTTSELCNEHYSYLYKDSV